ncbi:vasoactive intestinal polypeptide receptor 1-like isoform X2 [Mizuhopecten yessoensis]|uniref:vasoactive intestinal polypeptide receptor 1-like isoform X2 n=1 Tax=Mizuhopecten yessoensis TaxID=6573 RepID=UPI000B459A30|nr:vasoactive intestinal polypeptide receptor 1-like isoform X2 [Mizuhopecten yessoensis]
MITPPKIKKWTTYDIFNVKNVIQDEDTQRKALNKERLRCVGYTILDSKTNTNDSLKCPRIWDDIMCWSPTDAGTVAVQPCPKYIAKFNYLQNTTRMCMPDGTWFMKPGSNTSWTNFSACQLSSDNGWTVPRSFAKHMQEMRIMYNIGYGLSMTSLVVAVFIMIYFKKLHCSRNSIHLNLFLSFILRGGVSFVKENILIESVGFASDIKKEHGGIVFLPDVSHWECRLFFTIFNYIIAASYMWIFVEALYLQVIISVAVFSEKGRLKWFMSLGWFFPLTFIIPWAIVRATVDNENCWNTYYDKPWLIWIIYGPITGTIVINICIFTNIVRILFTKLNSSPCPETKKFRYRRLAKSTLILIPLFGVHYIVFTYVPFGSMDQQAIIYMLYVEMFCNSFQGFLLALLFCFLNSEVQSELKKAWSRHHFRRAESYRTRTSFLSRVSRSRHHPSNDGMNGSIQYTDRVSPMEMNQCPPIVEEKIPFTSELSQESVLENPLDNGWPKNDEVDPCLNNNHTLECQQTDNIVEDGCKGR